jgi:hypothetical protein
VGCYPVLLFGLSSGLSSRVVILGDTLPILLIFKLKIKNFIHSSLAEKKLTSGNFSHFLSELHKKFKALFETILECKSDAKILLFDKKIF